MGAAGLAVLLGALDTYVVVSVLEDIMRSVDIPINRIQLATPIITWYLLGYIAAMPLLGRLSDRFGRRLVLQASLALFIVGSVLTALAGTLEIAFQVPLTGIDIDVTALDQVLVGRVVQGVASGALLPVTLALAADLWPARRRAAVLGWVGAAQELGSVLGPVVGVGVVTLVHNHIASVPRDDAWRVVFWVNVPLALLAMVLLQFTVPKRAVSKQKVDVVGGLLLAVALGLSVIGLYNPEPDGVNILPPNGAWLLLGAAVAFVLFAVWESTARTKLIETAGMRVRPFLAAGGASVCAGAALMVTLVDVEIYARAVLERDGVAAVLTLVRFLLALPVGAILGGFLATRVGDRVVSVAGLIVAAGGYLLIATWPTDVLSAHYLGFLPALDTSLAIAGFGLGVVIGPLSSAALRAVPLSQAGIASALLVVARMSGMLIGVAALTTFGFYRLNSIVDGMPKIAPQGDITKTIVAVARQTQEAYARMFGEVFLVTAGICLVGAVIALFVAGGRHESEQTPTDEDEALVPSR
ncbi:MFS transporter [Tsukamurella sputi]|uniref:MFS-type drug efflux transporter P55 n=1 Tax=Tsukamurella sputi TaxID=2591848 RepID=A0A5C5RHD4_9ACTN|nr:MFS transporter [Tsukamurella sputi]TWS22479.1 MFS transporter [Tsukamurella sputi]